MRPRTDRAALEAPQPWLLSIQRELRLCETRPRMNLPPASPDLDELLLRSDELDWEPKYSDLRSIVETAWTWHRTHPEGYGKG